MKMNKHITEIILHNYRGYKHTAIPISAGLNVIYGEGDAGKSALEKALRWCLLDEKQGKFINKKITTPKGKIKSNEEVYVQVTFNTGEIIRRGADSSTVNLYWVGHVDKPFEEWGDPIKNFKEVPEDVLKVCNLSDVNVGKQFDSHFLLSSKGSEIAKDLNKRVNLEIIDTSQSNAKHFVTKVKREKEASEFNLKKFEQDLKAYDYLEEMGVALDEVEKVEKAIADNKEAQREIGLLLNTLDEAGEKLDKLKSVVSFKSEIESLQELTEKYEKLSMIRGEVDSTLSQLSQNGGLRAKYTNTISFKENVLEIGELEKKITESKKEIDSIDELLGLADVDKSSLEKVIAFKKEVDEIMELEKRIKTLNTDYDFISGVLDSVEKNAVEIRKKEVEIRDMRENLHGVCPTCGQELNSSDLEDHFEEVV